MESDTPARADDNHAMQHPNLAAVAEALLEARRSHLPCDATPLAGHLASAGCSLGDVFKANIYLTNLADWARFNAVYEQMMPSPLPVRTAVQAILLPGYLVEIEMWAVKAKE